MRPAPPRAGLAALALVVLLTVGPLLVLLGRTDGIGPLSGADLAALRFTLLQAGLSALLSTLLAVPVARALARRQFRGRALLVSMFGAPFILPVIVAVLGLLVIFGRAGPVSKALTLVGLPPLSIYGLPGVLLAHLFLNLPLAVRMILNGWEAIPPERFRLAAALDLGPREIARVIEWPMLRAVLPGLMLAIFLVCLTSFTAILVMGGGPAATSLSLAIYQAFRLEFDLGHAASLAILQAGLGLGFTALGLAMFRPAAFGAGRGAGAAESARHFAPPAPPGRAGAALDVVAIILPALFLIAPIGLALVEGLENLPLSDPAVFRAALRSIVIACVASLLSTGGALAIGLTIARLPPRPGRAADAAAMLALSASPLVLGTGIFLAIRPYADPVGLALPITALANALMALPFALRVLVPHLITLGQDYDRLAESLDLRGWPKLRHLILPRLRQPLAFAAGLSAALAMGDLGVVTLFTDPSQATLPLLLYERMGQYRLAEAHGIAVWLMAMSFGLFWMFDRTGHRDADA